VSNAGDGLACGLLLLDDGPLRGLLRGLAAGYLTLDRPIGGVLGRGRSGGSGFAAVTPMRPRSEEVSRRRVSAGGSAGIRPPGVGYRNAVA